MGNTMASRPGRSRFGTLVGLLGAALTFRLGTTAIAEYSMRPTLHDGDWVVVRRHPRSIRAGDVVIVEHPGRPGFDLVKRVSSIGVDGVVVVGDDPTAGSVDSTEFGPVPPDLVSARVLLRYRPLPPRLIR